MRSNGILEPRATPETAGQALLLGPEGDHALKKRNGIGIEDLHWRFGCNTVCVFICLQPCSNVLTACTLTRALQLRWQASHVPLLAI